MHREVWINFCMYKISIWLNKWLDQLGRNCIELFCLLLYPFNGYICREKLSFVKAYDSTNGQNEYFMFIFQLKSANTLLDQAQQPYNYLVESIRLRDTQINQQKEHIHTLEEDVRSVTLQLYKVFVAHFVTLLCQTSVILLCWWQSIYTIFFQIGNLK